MKALVYAALLVGAILMLVRTVRHRKHGIDSKIDIVAYSLMVLGLAVLFVTCVVEAFIGGPIIQS